MCARLIQRRAKMKLSMRQAAPPPHNEIHATGMLPASPSQTEQRITGASWTEERRGRGRSANRHRGRDGRERAYTSSLPLFCRGPTAQEQHTITRQRRPQELNSEMLGSLGISPAAADNTKPLQKLETQGNWKTWSGMEGNGRRLTHAMQQSHHTIS